MAAKEDKQSNSKQLVDAVVRAMEIMDCFSLQETEFSLNQLCEQTGMYKSRIHRLCGTLIATGYLVKTSRSNYRLGPKLMVLGKAYEKTNSLKSIAEPLMRQLSLSTGLSSALFVLDGMKCICMAREVGTTRLVYAINEGEYMELTPTAAGRVLLAYADESFVEKVLEQAEYKKFTEKTIVSVDTIRQELIEIRKRGFAFNMEGREEGVAAIAAPIFDFEKNVQAAVAIVGPVHLFNKEEYEQRLLPPLQDSAGEISRLMGTF
ncbi:IclR family transcriptional regulator [Desulforhopalus singaporensis]|uniref:Transcriptional regulator, IclR family n=1 Tax=Desulforhopalus singaporensis TaxID=91360 RepID=A0A1H0KMW9_9BACT|nr:IclR family transcriptional regulator [Desulforhopalus singaporensis]SDO57101.1 transcriptional regulator, IclR family [Desulforhopalus singaporensis]